ASGAASCCGGETIGRGDSMETLGTLSPKPHVPGEEDQRSRRGDGTHSRQSRNPVRTWGGVGPAEAGRSRPFGRELSQPCGDHGLRVFRRAVVLTGWWIRDPAQDITRNDGEGDELSPQVKL